MDDDAFQALQARVARLAAETARGAEELLAEIRRRGGERGGEAAVTPIRKPTMRPGGNSGP
jgi:hypothetical protein